jgi:hypothetical protein
VKYFFVHPLPVIIFLSIPVLIGISMMTLSAFTEHKDREMHADSKRLYLDVGKLASLYPSRNYKNPSSLDRAAEYIYKEFSACTDRVEYMKYKVNDIEYKNVAASFGPKDGERIIVGAHYDVCGDQPGADDNGTGTASLLELARLLSQLNPSFKFKHRIDLAAYTLEEPPYFRSPYMGSAVHAKYLADTHTKILVMISLDMFGYFSVFTDPERFVPLYITYGTLVHGKTTAVVGKKGDEEITKIIAKYMDEAPTGKDVHTVSLNLPLDITGVDYSDHLNFWNHRYTAVMVSNAFVCPSPNYHKPVDTIDTIDFKRVTEIVDRIFNVLINL